MRYIFVNYIICFNKKLSHKFWVTDSSAGYNKIRKIAPICAIFFEFCGERCYFFSTHSVHSLQILQSFIEN